MKKIKIPSPKMYYDIDLNKMYENEKQNNLSNWFYKLLDLSKIHNEIKLPKTTVFPDYDINNLFLIFDGKESSEFNRLISDIIKELDNYKLPCFIRSGVSSAKHYWEKTCYLQSNNIEIVKKQVYAILEFCAIVDIPINEFVIRELLPTNPIFYAFNKMPIAKERRYFIDKGKVIHIQPYWPPEAFVKNYFGSQLPDNWLDILNDSNIQSEEEVELLTTLSELVGTVLPGYWSVDWLLTTNGWYLTDMALGKNSYKWEVI